MVSLRMCAACREMKEKSELIRICKEKDMPARIDFTYKEPGRGVYVCRSEQCVNLVKKKGGIQRSLKGNVDPQIFDELLEMIKKG